MDKIEKLRTLLDEMIGSGKFNPQQILKVSLELDILIEEYDEKAKKNVC